VQLPEDIPPIKQNLLSLLKEEGADSASKRVDIADLALILRLTCCLTAKVRSAGGDFYYRSTASAGALYPTEIYAATSGIKGIDDGLYHFEIHRQSLSPLRSGDFTDHISRSIFRPAGKSPHLAIIFSAICFRSSWKYRDRAYRYHLLDTGHVIEDLFLAMKALRLPLDLYYDFNDKEINRLIGVDDNREVALAVAVVPGSKSLRDAEVISIEKLPENVVNMSIVSGHEIEYPAINEIHRAGEMPEEKKEHSPETTVGPSLIPEIWQDLPGSFSSSQEIEYPQCLFMRRSSRNFVDEPIGKNKIFSLLDSLCLNYHPDPGKTSIDPSILSIGFLAGNIEDISPGLYVLDTIKRLFGMVSSGSLTEKMSHVCLDQEWLKNAGVHFLFISNTEFLDRKYGPRGYRYAMMTAGRMGQRIYTAATSLGLGCCGIGAFYDTEAADLTGLSNGSRLLYLVAAGRVKRLLS
ncbi:MAG: SagB/ThcOx family dehydrogenase, partial [Deltaproteobacteria bacterium]|nr:SagB/ThcOx family dehydrogenase [Deltaproteobacteria bacterium]